MSLFSGFTRLNTTKAVNLGLHSIWLYGFLLICISSYATQLLPVTVKIEFRKPSIFHQSNVPNANASPTITIFSAVNGAVRDRLDLAVKSWLGLSADINVVLIGNDPDLYSFASGFSSRVSVESNIDFSFRNTPFFHSMVARAETSTSNISVIVHPETILLQDFISTLNHVYDLDHAWFLFAACRQVSSSQYNFDEAGKQRLKKDISSHKTWEWDARDERMLMAWNNHWDIPLLMGVLPPFLYGKGLHSRWLINEVYHSKYRFIFDSSETISNFHVKDSGIQPTQANWEYNGNRHLAESYGVFSSQQSSFSDLIKLVKRGQQFVFAKGKEKTVYSHGVDRIVSVPLQLPFGLETLLPIVADENNTIVLAIAGYSYKDMLMSWVCRLRHLMVPNFLVFALDDDTYQFSVLQGLPVVKDSLAPRNISFDDCHFGTKCFQKVTKTKSRLVLQILEMGYNVLLSDVDVYWFRNPLPFLQTFGPAILAAQSDEYNLTVPINLPRRLNSGFYFARSDKSTISALKKVVTHAMTSDLSEQPSFYDTLCGQGGSNCVGNDKCLEPVTNLTVQFLDRDLFPNGAYRELWNEESVGETCLKIGCYVIHNNWISGRIKKLQRQMRAGLWDYDTSLRMCFQSWHRTNVMDFS